MLYVLRDDQGEIHAMSDKALTEQWSTIPADDPAMLRFLQNNPETANKLMESSDVDFIRVLEDVVDLLMEKQIIHFTDFPDAVQQKLLSRRHYREHLISSEENTHLLDRDDELF